MYLGKFFRVNFSDLLTQLDITDHSFELGLIDDSQKPPIQIDERLPELRIQCINVQIQKSTCDTYIGQSDSLTNQKSSS